MEVLVAPARLWARSTAKAEQALSRGFQYVGKLCARHPFKCLFLSILFCLVFGAGFVQFESEGGSRELWVDQHSQQMKNLEFVESLFSDPVGSEGGGERLIVAAKNGGNILDYDTFLDVWRVVDDVRTLEFKGGDGGLESYPFVCRRADGDCIIDGVPRYFATRPLTQEDILHAVNRPQFADGMPTYAEDSLGGIQRDSSGQIVGASAVRVIFYSWSDGFHKAWMAHFVENFKTIQRYERVNVFLQSAGSFDDELNRTVSADIPLFASAFVLMSTFCAVFIGKPCSWTASRRLLGVSDLLLVLIACVGGFGSAMLLGVKFTVLSQILPFILVGIGIDDAFVIVNAFDRTDDSLDIPERVGQAMGRVGVSITLTSLTDIVAFLLGATCVFPAIQFFCYYAAVSCCFVWMVHCTAFCAMLSLDAARAKRHLLDPFFCVPATSSCIPSEPTDSTKTATLLSRMLGVIVRFCVRSTLSKLLTVSVFLGVAGTSLWQVSLGIGTDFKLIDLTPDGSYLSDYYTQEERYFGGIAIGLAVPASFYVQGLNFSSLEVQRNLELVGAEMLNMRMVNEDRGLRSWHTIFSLWAWQNRGSLDVLPLTAFEEVPGGASRPGCRAGLPPNVNDRVTHFLTGSTFQDALLTFLGEEQFGDFYGDLHFSYIYTDGSRRPDARDREEGDYGYTARTVIGPSYGSGGYGSGSYVLDIARLMVRHADTANSVEQVEALEEAEELTRRWQSALPGSFMNSFSYIFYDQFRIIVAQMTTSVALCLLAVTIISTLVLAHPLLVMSVVLVLALVFVNLLGNIILWDLDLNTISMINLVMAVGLVVDYSMHVAHNFSLQDDKLDRAERAARAVEEIGPAIFLGISTTFVAMIPLAFSSSQAFRVFFKMFVGIVVAGGSHGLVFLPVCLSLVGPGGTAEPEMKIQPESCAKGAATEQISNVIGANESNVAVTTLPDDHEGRSVPL